MFLADVENTEYLETCWGGFALRLGLFELAAIGAGV